MLLANLFDRFVSRVCRPNHNTHITRRRMDWSSVESLEVRALLTPTVSLIKALGPYDDSIGLMKTDQGLFFSVNQFGGTSTLWVTDGTGAGTVKLREFYDIRASGEGASFVGYHGEIYFAVTGTGDDPNVGLWKSDGTVGGTVQVLAMDGPPNDFVVMNDKIYFNGVDDEHGWELWTSDGTADGTHMVLDLLPGTRPGLDIYGGGATIVFQNELYFAGQSTAENLELWASDGTAERTRLVKNIFTGSYVRPFDGVSQSNSNPRHFTVLNDRLVFSASTDAMENGLFVSTLWTSDGTTDGTVEIKELNGSVAGTTATRLTSPDFLGTYQDRLYFSPATDDPQSNRELWVTDGSLAGTRFVKDLRTGESQIFELTGSNGLVYFNAGDDTHGEYEPWVSDGTAAGTHLLVDLAPGTDRDGDPNSSRPSQFFPFGDRYTVFRANAENKGAELWMTDGTAGGTQRITDLFPGRNGSFPYPFTNQGDSLLFFANDNALNGLYRLTPNDETGGPQISPQSFNIAENSAADTVVGTVTATGSSKQKLIYAITGGDPNGIFTINPQTGQLTVQNPAGLDFETQATVQLTVRVAVAKTPSLSASATVTIHLTDQAESVSINLSSTSLSVPAKSTPRPVDPQATITFEGPEPSSWAGVVLAVNVAKNRQSKDLLSVQSTTTGEQSIIAKGKSLFRGSTAIATVAGGKGKLGTLRVSFLAAATSDDVESVVRQIAFSTKGASSERQIALQLLGVNGKNSAAAARRVQVG